MRYSREALEEMASKIDLKSYAERSVEFKKHNGNTFFALCPFHREKTPSLAINADKNYFHCFGCGQSGDIYKWIQLTENLSFGEAVARVASLTNTDLKDYIEPESVGVYREMKRIMEPKKMLAAERTYLDPQKDYFGKYSDELPQEWLDEGIPADVLRKYEIRVDKSSNRIVYPVYDADFRLIGVKGRTRFKDYKTLKIMKYLNYTKVGYVDYFTGMKQARDEIVATKSIIIVEGIKSVMKLDAFGYHNAVSAETSAINEKQVELLIKMGIRDVIIAFDKDVQPAKIKQYTRMLTRYANVYMVVDRMRYLDEKDSPCDKGKEVWDDLYRRKERL